LYCHAFLRQQGFIVEVQQVVDQAVGRPVDFLASSAGVPLFYMEATVANDARETLANQRKVDELIDALNALNEPDFRVSFEIERESNQNLPFTRIRSAIHSWLQTLDASEVAEQRREEEYERHPHYTWDDDGWRIVFFAIPRAREEQGKPDETVLYHSWNARRVEAQISLKDALKEKADRYGQLELPYVIAVDVLAIDSIGTDVGEILFGKEIALIDTQSGTATITRSPLLYNRPHSENGLWFGRGGPKNQQISAVLLVNELMPWAIAHKTPILWHNPWAGKPLDPALWQVPQMLPDMNASPPRMQRKDGKQAHEIFHLPADWPDTV
jgi:hypothetical protein